MAKYLIATSMKPKLLSAGSVIINGGSQISNWFINSVGLIAFVGKNNIFSHNVKNFFRAYNIGKELMITFVTDSVDQKQAIR